MGTVRTRDSTNKGFFLSRAFSTEKSTESENNNQLDLTASSEIGFLFVNELIK